MRLDGVWFRYHRHGPWVLRQVDVAVGPGEVAVVLGRNGAGKSTLLQLTAGVLRPSRGRVADRPPVVGWVPERFPADQPFTVGAYLTAMGRVAGLPGPAADRAVRHWVERLGLARFHDVRLPRLSKGTAQKVGLAQALLRPPGLLVLDEPWEGLDAAAREAVPEIIGDVLAAGGAVLVSDHRGETVRLPGARHWSVTDGTVTEQAPSGGAAVAVVELAVPAAGLAAAVARLRADGHQILRVRDHAVPPPATHPVPASVGPSADDDCPDADALSGPVGHVDAGAGDSGRPGPAPEVAR
ncbi:MULTISPECIES: ATP-binding cassette domain-containing protein [unclassified Micromonospora]|uniref:ATP-binding cassette domain-containing protein n=1 Tax=unclassified Micromonospora TaxID=2617518 RepID=UPI0003EECFFA|nr:MULTISPECIES: ABC transporter ATP-binding protein [unclassified Micromonospora]EWM67434.1 zinc import ATP-binding protein ZnuC [Micromonospora sp. M42]MCK1807326.1 ABC transporter ATP-binding protein [Micromonospora sp. R42106]MCK1831984.1 ABC transporter ATP-binding protein [Micromonospora sp. R42003]MCK1843174.1 ABC transporter ATP-binding protein [Micromonospora sp. R42004]MCM1017921.1 ABC transporter ATP-binding protein [Micromonospora sp. XM-20-01]